MERYSRNIAVKEISEQGQKKLLSTKVLIAGAGGLGSTVIANLTAAGIGTLGLIDNDVLELTNLNRQYIHKFENIGKPKVNSAKQWINEYNADVNVQIHNIKLNETNEEDIIKQYDIVIDCFDSFKSKYTLNNICSKHNKPLIHGGVTEFYGQVMVIVPGQTACLNCFIPDFDVNAYIVKGVISPSVSTIASIQSMEAIKLITGVGELLTNKILIYNGLTQEFKKIKLSQVKNCPTCGNGSTAKD